MQGHRYNFSFGQLNLLQDVAFPYSNFFLAPSFPSSRLIKKNKTKPKLLFA